MIVAAVSGGPDSMYLLHELVRRKRGRVFIGHVNHGARGSASGKDQKLVEKIAGTLRLEIEIHKAESPGVSPGLGRSGERGGVARFPPGFEENARKIRYGFLARLAKRSGAGKIALAHTADDQVETILMRVFEGSGISGLKGIPRETEAGIIRPILDVWKEDIIKYLKKHMIHYRIDRSNLDTRFERNWVRHVLMPLLVKRYGKSVKKRIFTLGERFRELDDYLDIEAHKWMLKNLKVGPGNGSGPGTKTGSRQERGRKKVDVSEPPSSPEYSPAFSCLRQRYSGLPVVLGIRILQKICFDRLGLAPNERLLKAMDRVLREGGPSARLKIGNGWALANRYGEALFTPQEVAGRTNKGQEPAVISGPGKLQVPIGVNPGRMFLAWVSKGKVTPAQARRTAARGDRELFDASFLRPPLTVRPLRAGDRIRPFGLSAEKKVKELLIDRKVPRGERWGRPVVCNAHGEILWIPGVVRSGHAPVTTETKRTALLEMVPGVPKPSRKAPSKAEPVSRSGK